MSIIVGCICGFIAWFLVRYLIAGLYTVDQNERTVEIETLKLGSHVRDSRSPEDHRQRRAVTLLPEKGDLLASCWRYAAKAERRQRSSRRCCSITSLTPAL